MMSVVFTFLGGLLIRKYKPSWTSDFTSFQPAVGEMRRCTDSGRKEKLPSVFRSEVNRQSANLVSYGLSTLVKGCHCRISRERNLDFKDQSWTSIFKEEAGFSSVIIFKNSTAQH